MNEDIIISMTLDKWALEDIIDEFSFTILRYSEIVKILKMEA